MILKRINYRPRFSLKYFYDCFKNNIFYRRHLISNGIDPDSFEQPDDDNFAGPGYHENISLTEHKDLLKKAKAELLLFQYWHPTAKINRFKLRKL